METAVDSARDFVALLRARAQRRPDDEAFRFLSDGEDEAGRLSYGQLDRTARAVAARLQASAAEGERALLLYPPGLELIAAFFACLYGAVIAVPTYPPRGSRGRGRLRTIVRDARPGLVLTTGVWTARKAKLAAEIPELADVEWIATDEIPPEARGEWRPPRLDDASIAFLQYTSGSISSPKGVRITHGNLFHNEELIRRTFGQSRRSVVVGWLPLYHDMGLIGTVLQPVYSGGRAILTSPAAFLQRPARWLEAVSRFRADTSGGPNFAYELCCRRISPEERAGLDLSCWRVAFNGAEPVRATTLRRFARHFAPHGFDPRAFVPCYGLAEATLMVSGGSGAGTSPPDRPVSCGRPPPELSVEIVDSELREPRADGEVGEIWVAGASVASGYWRRPQLTEQTFQAFLADGRGPYLRTGDLGLLDDGELCVTGRIKELIILRGRNHYPQDLELTVEASHPVFRPGGGAAFSVDRHGEERLVVAFEVDRHAFAALASPEPVAEAARRAVAREHEARLFELVLLPTGRLPKTSSGKVQRLACRQAFLAAELPGLWRSSTAEETTAEATSTAEATPTAETTATADDPWPPPDPAALRGLPEAERRRTLAEALRRLAAQLLGRDLSSLPPDRPLAAHGLDSLSAAELASRVEEALGVATPPSDLLDGLTLDGWARAISRRLTAPDRPTPPAEDGTTAFPLSHGQRALWFLSRSPRASAAYNLHAAFRTRSKLDVDAWRDSWRRLIERHGVLRSVVRERDGVPYQDPEAAPDDGLAVEDASTWAPARLLERLREEAWRPFDLARHSPLRVLAWRVAGGGHVLLIVVHHLAADFRSLAILSRELGDLYRRAGEEPESLEPLTASYRDFVSWQARMLGSPQGQAMGRRWRERLAGAPALLTLETDRPRPARPSFRGGAERWRWSPRRLARLEARGGAWGATLFVQLAALLQALLARYSGQSDVLIGAPAAGRGRPEWRGLVGYFVNPLVLRGDLSDRPGFEALVARTRAGVLAALRDADYPFPRLVERLRPERDASTSPLFQVMLAVQQANPEEAPSLAALGLGKAGIPLRLGDLELESLDLGTARASHELTLEAARLDGALELRLTYHRDLFDATTVRRLLGHLRNLADAAVDQPRRPLFDLPLLGRAERCQLLVQRNDTPARGGADFCLHEPFEAQAARRPDRVALVDHGRWVSYGELERRAERVARALASRGVGAEQIVAVCLRRTPRLVAALLGILKAGAAYLPLDPKYPERRLAFMLRDATAALLLTEPELRDRLPGDPDGRPPELLLDDTPPAVEIRDEPASQSDPASHGDPAGRVQESSPRHLAYLIYTSGSTGRPKAVAIEHRNAAALLDWGRTAASDDELSGLLASSSVSFDLSVYELFLPLSRGGRVVLSEDALELPRLPDAALVRTVNTVPSVMEELVRQGAIPESVTTVQLAGETLTGALARRIHALPHLRRLVNLYGPAEDTTYSSSCEVRPRDGAQPPLGRPLPGTRFLLLDRGLSPAPLGVAAEICIAGDGLARGYLGRPGRTAASFVPDPYSGEPGGRLYRSGDLARYRSDGGLAFLGRTDHQVKLRGFRIETGEVSAALRAHPEVLEAVTVLTTDPTGERRLVAYVVPMGDARPEPDELHDALRRALPDYMVPSAFVQLPSLPLTANGKIDRRALPAPSWDLAASGGGAPETPFEELLAGIWRELLPGEEIARSATFFAAGGHSLLAVRLLARLRSELGVELPLDAVYEDTLGELAARVERAFSRGDRPAAPDAVPRWDRAGGTPPPDAPLSFAQERFWFLHQLEPASAAYHLAGGLRLAGRLSVEALADGLRTVVRRHEVLRSRFVASAAGLRQETRGGPAGGAELAAVDLRRLDPGRRQREATDQLRLLARRPFDLATDGRPRAALFGLGRRDHLLAVVLHHIVADGESIDLLLRELEAVYRARLQGTPAALPELEVQYGDFAVWQRRRHAGDATAAELDHWRRQLAGAPSLLELPTDRPRPARRSSAGAQVRVSLPDALGRRLDALARDHRATLFMVLLAAFKTLLHRLSHQDDVVVGTPVAQRTRRELEPLIGCFLNTLVLRDDLSGQPAFSKLLRGVRATVLAALAHQELPFERLVDELAGERTPDRSPLFQVMFAFRESRASSFALPGLTATRVAVDPGSVKLDLSLDLERGGDHLEGVFRFSTRLFDRTTLERIARRFRILLEAVADDPGRRLAELPVLGRAERHQLLQEWSRGHAPAADVRPIHRQVAARARLLPESIAVVEESRFWTYGELARQADRLARHLAKLGVGPEVPVGLLLEPSFALVTAVLAVLEAGGAYLPLDPRQPRQRLAGCVRDSRAPVVVTLDALDDTLAGTLADALAGTGARAVRLDAEADLIASADDPGPIPEIELDHPAYLLYTSGTTGRPKATAISHRSLAHYLSWVDEDLLGDRLDELPWTTRPTFDAALKQLFHPLLRGRPVRPLPEAEATRPESWLRRAARRGRVGLNCVPALWRSTLETLAEGGPAGGGPEMLLLGGESVAPDLVERSFRIFPDVEIWNLYGPTETTANAACERLAPGRTPAIGRPIRGARLWVLDRFARPVAAGVAGELFIGGTGLARGYLRRSALTAGRFVPDAYGERPGERLYRTGDLVRHRADGRLEILGRLDQQLKIHGIRVEAGEIEHAITTHSPEVREAVVRVVDGAAGHTVLVAYVVPHAPPGPTAAELREMLAPRLPAAIIPSAVVVLDRLPRLPNGKIDYRGLPPLPPAGAERSLRSPPRGGTEQLLAELWASLLGVERVGAHDDFFALGGHSLLAARLTSRIRELFGVELPLSALFESPTLAQLAARIDALESDGDAPPPPAVPPDGAQPGAPPGGAPRLSFAQERLWFLDRLMPESPAYNIPVGLEMRGSLGVAGIAILAAALGALVRRHQVLRTAFPEQDGEPRPRIRSDPGLPLPIVDLAGLDGAPRDRLARRLLAADARRPFDLAAGPLLRATLLRLGAARHLLILDLHHIVADGWSLGILTRELAALYRAGLQGEPDPLPPLPWQYVDFAAWQRAWLRGATLDRLLGFWRRQLDGAGEETPLPTDRPRPAVRSLRGATHPVRWPRALAESLTAFAHAHRATPFIVLLAGLESLLARYGDTRDVRVGCPVAGRTRRDTEDLVGLFVNTLVMRVDLGGDPSFEALLGRTRQTALAAFAHQDLPFEQLVDHLELDRRLSHNPLFQVLFSLQNAAEPPPSLPGSTTRLVATDSGTSKVDLALMLRQTGGRLEGFFEYSTDLFDAATLHRLSGHLERLLAAAVRAPRRRLSQLPLQSPAERHHLLIEANDTRASERSAAGLHQLFAARAARAPDATALVCGDEHVSYRELRGRAARLAGRLRASGVAAESRVAVLMDRTPRLAAALLGVLEAGGAYVPLDPSYPSQRLRFMLEDSGAEILLSEADRRLPMALPPAVRRLAADGAPSEIETPAEAPALDPRQLAYVIYTSGSTGRPKAVALTHGGAVTLVGWALRVYDPGDLAAVLASTSICFDLSVFELFVPLAAGGTVILVGDALALLTPAPAVARARLLNLVPSVLEEVLRVHPLPAAARVVNLAGEALRRPLVDRLKHRFGVRVHNLYGPSEDTTYSTHVEVSDAAGAPTIGRPVDATRAQVLDPNGRPVPMAVPGELHLAGAGLARGYLARPALTAERFRPDPAAGTPGERRYATGDLARYRPDGELEFLGRLDHQVKIRGFRIELGEIEQALGRCPGVGEAVVVAREDRPGEKRLAAYLVTKGPLDVAEVRAELGRRLPAYMVPSVFRSLDALPLNANGKVDRAALERLPPDDGAVPASGPAYVAPRDPVETAIAGVWSRVLRREPIGVHDNFFQLGGDSILSIRVIAGLKKAGLELTPRQIFQHQTIAELAPLAGSVVALAEQGAVTGVVPLAPRQLMMLELDWPRPQEVTINALFEVPADVHGWALRHAVRALIEHHDALRSRFARNGGEWRQWCVAPDGEPPFSAVDLDGLAPPRRPAAIRDVAAAAQGSLDLERGPLLRVVWIRQGGETPGRLLIVTHHLVMDGVSGAVLATDLQSAYRHHLAGRGPGSGLPPKTTSFRQWAERMRRHSGEGALAELDFWLDPARLAVRPLPVDLPRGHERNVRGSEEAVTASLGRETTRRLLGDAPRAAGATFNDLLMTALAVTFARWTSRRSLLVDVMANGREPLFDDVDLSRTIGWFAASYPVLLDLGPAADPRAALPRIRDQLRRVPERGLGYGLLRYMCPDRAVRDRLRALPAADMIFNFLGHFGDDRLDDGGETGERWPLAPEPVEVAHNPTASSPWLMHAFARVAGGDLTVRWGYSRNAHRRETAEALLRGFFTALREIAEPHRPGSDTPL